MPRGKIQSLPQTVRYELNHRLWDGESQESVRQWLNQIPLVQECMKARFHGHLIDSENISQWFLHEFQDWVKKTTPTDAPVVYRKGKIARLPYQLRQELNHRLHDQQTGASLVSWLNGQQTVLDRLQLYFGGCLITEQNLSEWRRGGYQDYLHSLEAHENV